VITVGASYVNLAIELSIGTPMKKVRSGVTATSATEVIP